MKQNSPRVSEFDGRDKCEAWRVREGDRAEGIMQGSTNGLS